MKEDRKEGGRKRGKEGRREGSNKGRKDAKERKDDKGRKEGRKERSNAHVHAGSLGVQRVGHIPRRAHKHNVGC